MKAIEAAKAAMIKARDVCLESSSPRSADEMVTFMLMPAIRAYLTALAEDGAAVERVAEIIRTSVEFGYTDDVINAPEVARAAIRAMGGE